MGIIKWWNDRKKKEEAQVEMEPKSKAAWELPKETVSDDVRVKRYVEDGGKIVDLSNKPRKDNDGFPPDQELLTPFNRAHTGAKEGLSSLMKGKR